MIYEAKKGTEAYEYVKRTLDAEYDEYLAYIKRVKEAVGFDFKKYQGYRPNSSATREHEISAIWVPSAKFEAMDKKLWRKVDSIMMDDGPYIAIVPNKRYKQGKKIARAFTSYKPVTYGVKIMDELHVRMVNITHLNFVQLLRHNDRIFVEFDDGIRADKDNPDFVEITMGEYEDFVNSDKEEK